VTVVLTTHDMDEAAKLCDRVGIVDHGKLLALDTPSALTRGLPGSTTLSVVVDLAGVAAELVGKELSDLDGVERVERINVAGPPAGMAPGVPGMPPGMPVPGGVPPGGMSPDADGTGQFRLYMSTEAAAVLPAVLNTLGGLGSVVRDLSIGTPSLEDVFIHLTGRELR
jgi:ABC-2 type transport system ATP-binding protein